MSDGTRVQKICHTVGSCRKRLFPYDFYSVAVSDIVEVRCNVEVHEQTQDSEDLFMSFSDEIDDLSTLDEDLGAVSNTSVKLYSGLDSKYHFSRFAGNHVEIHYNFVEKENENFCRAGSFLNQLVPEDPPVCKADISVVQNFR